MSSFPFDKTRKWTSLDRHDPVGSTANRLPAVSDLVGRIFLSLLFLFSGFGKVTGYAETAAFMESAGVPSGLLPLAIVVELVSGIALVLGWRVRFNAFLLGGYSLLTGVLFHSPIGDPMQWLQFLKNVALAGGCLLLMANGAGALSFDRRAGR